MESSLREQWSTDLKWILTDQNKDEENCKKATYSSKQIFELLSTSIFSNDERNDFKELSLALTDYLKLTNFFEEINPLQQAALAIAVGYYYRKLEEKHIVEIKEKSSDS